MKRQLSIPFLLAVLASGPAKASEAGLLYDRQIGSTQVTIPRAYGAPTRQEGVRPNGFALRGAYTLGRLAKADLALTATFHPEIQDAFIQDIYPWPPQRFGSFSTKYSAVGAQLDWHLGVDFHAGLELRREALKATLGQGDIVYDTTTTRPWASVGLGYTFAQPAFHPFIRLEAAQALTHASLGAAWTMEDLLKSMAPRSQVGLYAGIHF